MKIGDAPLQRRLLIDGLQALSVEASWASSLRPLGALLAMHQSHWPRAAASTGGIRLEAYRAMCKRSIAPEEATLDSLAEDLFDHKWADDRQLQWVGVA